MQPIHHHSDITPSFHIPFVALIPCRHSSHQQKLFQQVKFFLLILYFVLCFFFVLYFFDIFITSLYLFCYETALFVFFVLLILYFEHCGIHVASSIPTSVPKMSKKYGGKLKLRNYLILIF